MRLSPQDLESVRKPLTEASALPAEAYRSSEIWDLERERIFRREWLCVGRVEQVPEPGDYVALDLDAEPVVLVRDLEGRVRVLSRVCRHRWTSVVEGSGNRRSFQCPYHLWTYGLDGRLIGAPEMQQASGFDRSACSLPALPIEVWEGFVFASLDPQAAPLTPELAGLTELLAGYSGVSYQAVEPLVYDSPWNWKVMVDNFMESYHHVGVHHDTLEPLFPGARTFSLDSDGPWSVLRMPTRDTREVKPGAPDPSELVACVIWPHHLFAFSPNALVWYQLLVDAVDHFTLKIHLCVPTGASADAVQAQLATVDAVHQQDITACQAVQRGLASRLARPGRLSHLEKSLWQFNQWWCDRIAES